MNILPSNNNEYGSNSIHRHLNQTKPQDLLPKNPRLFIAFNINLSTRQAIRSLLPIQIPNIRHTSEESWHVTLHFIGDACLEQVDAALKNISHNMFFVKLKGVGAFPSPKYPNVLWAGIQVTEELSSLHRMIAKELDQIGIQIDRRRYVPHITIGKFKYTRRRRINDKRIENKEMMELVQNHVNLGRDLPAFPITEFVLFESVPSQQVLYIPRKRYPLVHNMIKN